ncbi:hypothetical protein GOBAR_AA24170 [Gossypium barbadense]|uniref:Uncharacterized protein n=1 Tax=Gossypium barbadense TaxID=3634 RepID=A0A2P5WZJ6_GOSBA|nr:hypothetical protein GOBAR_AA24170 [Gossypium barbadense]
MQKKEEENGELCETIKEKQDLVPFDGKVGVSGKSAEEAKYAPLKSFPDSNVPENVLECCKDFSSPSPIHAWPFLLEGYDEYGSVSAYKEISFVQWDM